MHGLTLYVTREEEFPALEKEWNLLLSQSEADNVFLTWEWVSTWWKVFGRGKFLYPLTFREGPELVGIAPLYIRRTRYYGLIPAKTLMFLGTGENVRSEYQDLIVKQGYEKRVADEFIAHLKKSYAWDIAVFKDLRSGSPLLPALENPFPGEGLPQSAWAAENSYAVKLVGSYSEYLKTLPKQLRKFISGGRRRLESHYAVKYRRLTKKEELPDWMAELKKLHRKRMRQRKLAGTFKDRDYLNFHSAVAESFFSRGRLLLDGLDLNGRPAAIRYGFLYRNKVYGYQTGFDPEFAREGVMQLLTSRSIEAGFAAGYSEIDLLAGEYRHKTRLANSVRRLFTFTVFNDTAAGRVAAMANRARAWSRRAARRRIRPASFGSQLPAGRHRRFYTRNFAAIPPRPGPVPEMEIERIETANNAFIPGIVGPSNRDGTREIAARLRKGHFCLAAIATGRPAALIWIDPRDRRSKGRADQDSRAGEAFIYDCRIEDKWRGMNIPRQLFDSAAERLEREGFKAMTMLLNPDDREAIKIAAGAGFRAVK